MAKLSFNATHPELEAGEEFYMNVAGNIKKIGEVYRHQSKNNPEWEWRIGKRAYTSDGEVIENSVPLFRRKKPVDGATAESETILRQPLSEADLMGTGLFDPASEKCVTHEEKPDPIFDPDRIHPGQLKPGDKVTYTPTGDRGIVKSETGSSSRFVHVVYNCGGNWHAYHLYTAASTNIRDLKKGWSDER